MGDAEQVLVAKTRLSFEASLSVSSSSLCYRYL